MKDQEAKISFLRLRKYIGVLGFSLPIAISVHSGLLSSISYSYYTNSHDLFVGSLYAIGLFLFCDKGYDSRDMVANRIAGFCALLVANFPCNGNYSWIHYLSASVLFSTLGYISLCLFTETKGVYTHQKMIRDTVYTSCGIAIFLSVFLIFAFTLLKIHIFIPESICLFSFGFSWLVKGDTLFKD